MSEYTTCCVCDYRDADVRSAVCPGCEAARRTAREVAHQKAIAEAAAERTRECFRLVASHASPASASWIKSAYPEAFAAVPEVNP